MKALFLTLICFWMVDIEASMSYAAKPQYMALLLRLDRLEEQYKFIEKTKLFESSRIELDDPFDKIFVIEPSAAQDSSGILCRWERPFERNLATWKVNAP